MMTRAKKENPLLEDVPLIEIVVLAAGLGTRMKSDLPKVLHRICGKPMLAFVLEQLQAGMRSLVAGPHNEGQDSARLNIVVGYGREKVEQAVRELIEAKKISMPVVFTYQQRQLGTGHAVKLALEQPTSSGAKIVAVINGDLPLFTSGLFCELVRAHLSAKSSATLASGIIHDAGQYGRVVRKNGTFVRVVEFKDATTAQRRIREYNGGVYVFDAELLRNALSSAGNNNAAGEFYLPDVFAYAAKKKKKILAHCLADAVPLSGVNNMKELAAAQKVIYVGTAEALMAEGVFIPEPEHTYIAPSVRAGRGCVIGPFSTVHGDTVLADHAQIGAHCEVTDVTIGEGSVLKTGTVAERSSVGREAQIGPMARLRPGSRIGDHVKIGNFVEIKEAMIGEHTAISHLSYVGDAEIGANCNLGCGFITCNFDGTVRNGRRKHRTVIGNRVFVGSDSQVVAPIELADGVYVASGSTVTESVHDQDSLVIGRSRQVTKLGYAKKYRPD